MLSLDTYYWLSNDDPGISLFEEVNMSVNNIDLDNKQRKKSILAGVYILQGYIMATDLGAMLAIPKTLEQFGAQNYYGILITCYVLAMAIATPVGGKLGDLFGRKNAIVAGTAIFAFGTILCAVSPNFIGYFTGFMIFGIGMGLMLPLLIAMISDVTTQTEFPKFMGYYTSVNNVSMLIGPLLSGVITDLVGPGLVYVYLLPIGGIALWLINKNYKGKLVSDEKPLVDYLGILFLILSAGPILLLFNLGGTAFSWLSVPSLALIVLGVIFTLLFVKHESKCKEPIVSIELFKKPVVAMGFLRTLTFMAYSSIVSSYLLLFAQQGIGISATVSGTLTLPKTIATILLPAAIGTWVAKKSIKGLKTALITAGAAVICGCMILGIGAGTSIAVIMIYISMVLLGVGESFYFVSNLPHIKSLLPAEKVGTGISINTFLSTFAIALYGAIFGGVLNGFNNDIMGAFPTICYIGAFCAFLYILLSVLGVKIPKKQENGGKSVGA